MSRRYLGETFDIHGGGEDLIFPHHENEIAQSAAATGKPLARYWMHNGFVKINSEKMSKSLGNIFPVKEILKHYHPEVLRLFMLQSHYRSPVDYSDDSLSEARAALFRCYRTLQQMKELQGQLAAGSKPVATQPSGRVDDYVNAFQMLKDKFNEAMDDDFNTAQALGYVFDMVRQMNNFMMKEKACRWPTKPPSWPQPSGFLIISVRCWASSTAMQINSLCCTGKPSCADAS